MQSSETPSEQGDGRRPRSRPPPTCRPPSGNFPPPILSRWTAQGPAQNARRKPSAVPGRTGCCCLRIRMLGSSPNLRVGGARASLFPRRDSEGGASRNQLRVPPLPSSLLCREHSGLTFQGPQASRRQAQCPRSALRPILFSGPALPSHLVGPDSDSPTPGVASPAA